MMTCIYYIYRYQIACEAIVFQPVHVSINQRYVNLETMLVRTISPEVNGEK